MKALFAAVALAFSLPAVATCTWTSSADGTSGNVVCTTVAETAFAGTASEALGWPLVYCPKGIVITACVDSTRNLTAAATLSVYVFDTQPGLWAKNPDLNITTATITATERCQNFIGIWTVVPAGRIAVIPTAGTLSAGNFTTYFRCN